MQRIFVVALLSVILFAVSNQSSAQMVQNLMIGNAKAMALGNAVTADPPGIDSIHFNPAGLTRLKGRQFEGKFIMAQALLEADFILANEDVIAQYDERGYTDPIAGQHSEINKFAVYLPKIGLKEIPVNIGALGGMSFNKPGSKLTFANSMYAPMMIGLTRKDDDPGRFYGKSLAVTRLTYFAPSVGYQWTDRFAVGISVGFSFMGVALDLPYRTPSEMMKGLWDLTNDVCPGRDGPGFYTLEIPGLDVCGGEGIDPFDSVIDLQVELDSNLSLSTNIGFLWDVTEWLTVGMVYQTEAVDNLQGDINFIIDESILALLKGVGSFSIQGLTVNEALIDSLEIPEDGSVQTSGSIEIVTPQHLSFGISMMVLPKLKVNIDLKWTETSKWEALNFVMDEDLPVLEFVEAVGVNGINGRSITIPRGYVDTVNWGVGIEYAYSPRLDLRFGYEPRKMGIPDDKRDFLIPIADINVVAVGFSYKISDKKLFDFTLAGTKSDEYIASGTSTNGNDHTNFNNYVFNPTAGLDTHSIIKTTFIEMSYRSMF